MSLKTLNLSMSKETITYSAAPPTTSLAARMNPFQLYPPVTGSVKAIRSSSRRRLFCMKRMYPNSPMSTVTVTTHTTRVSMVR